MITQETKQKVKQTLDELIPLALEGIKGPGTARGIMVLIGLVVIMVLHPEVAGQYKEILVLAMAHGLTDILRRK